MWLGGLLNPEAYITATRQCIAQANSWSLEELILDVTITDALEYDSVQQDECSFGVIGKHLYKKIYNDILLITIFYDLRFKTTGCTMS